MKTSIRNKLKTLQNVAVRFVEIEQNQEEQKVGKINRVYLKNSDKKLSMQDGYPTLFRIHGGQVEYFQGGRSAEEMENFYLKNGENQLGGEGTPQKQEGGFNLFGLFSSEQTATKEAEAAAAEAEAESVRPVEQTAPAPAAAPFSFSNFFTNSNKPTTTSENKYNILGGKSKKNRTKKPKKIKSTRKHKKS